MSELGVHQPGWSVTDASIEAFFVRAMGPRIKANLRLLAELKALGIDPTEKLKPQYPAGVYEQGMMSVRNHLFANEPDDTRAWWAMGRETTAGFYRTVMGAAIGSVMKLLPPQRMLPRLPANITNTTNYMKASVVEKAPRHWELYVFGSNHPAFVAGAVERGVEQTGTKARVEVVKQAPLEAWLSITW